MPIRRDCRIWKQALVRAANGTFSERQCKVAGIPDGVSASRNRQQILDEFLLAAMSVAQPPP